MKEFPWPYKFIIILMIVAGFRAIYSLYILGNPTASQIVKAMPRHAIELKHGSQWLEWRLIEVNQ